MSTASANLDHLDLDPETLRELLTAVGQANLEPLQPQEGVEMYLDSRESEVTQSTLKTHRSRLSFFVAWCDDNQISNLNDLTGRDLQEFRSWRKKDLSIPTLASQMRTLRLFLRKCAKFDAVHPRLPDKVDVPSMKNGQHTRDDIISAEFAAKVLKQLDKFAYAQLDHAVWLLLTDAGLRLASAHSLDIEDFERTENGGVLRLEHRPQSGTRLKNGGESDRMIHISEYAASRIQDFIEKNRPDMTDSNGRSPLLATHYGRLTKSGMRKFVYKWSRPCIVSNSCPHDEELDECKARQSASYAYSCPSSKSPHAIRRGYLTTELDSGVPKDVLSDRCDVSPSVMDVYYDKRSPESRMRLRREIREAVYGDSNARAYARDQGEDA